MSHRFKFFARYVTGLPVAVAMILAEEVVSLVSRYCESNMMTGYRPLPVRLERWLHNTRLDLVLWVWQNKNKAYDANHRRTDTGSSIRAFYL